MRAVHWVALLAALAAACDSKPRSDPLPGGGGACIGSFFLGAVQHSAGACTLCGDADAEQSIDGERGTYAYNYQTGGTYTLRATAPAGVSFPAGNFAGALMRIPAAYAPGTNWTFSTYLGGVLQETRNVANADGADPNSPGGDDDYYGFIASVEFDAVEIGMNGGSSDAINVASDPVRIYEFCGQR